MRIVFAVVDYRQDPHAVIEELRRKLDELVGATHTGVVRIEIEASKGGSSAPNRAVARVQLFCDDMPNPITTEFPVECATSRQAERLSEEITCGIRRILENANVQAG